MILLLAVAATALEPPRRPLSWDGTAEVYPPGKVVRIAVRTRIDDQGNVVSESWPVDVGEAKGMHRMTLDANGGTTNVGGKEAAMPAAMWAEERAQYGFYQQLQLAAARAPTMLLRRLSGRSAGIEARHVQSEIALATSEYLQMPRENRAVRLPESV